MHFCRIQSAKLHLQSRHVGEWKCTHKWCNQTWPKLFISFASEPGLFSKRSKANILADLIRAKVVFSFARCTIDPVLTLFSVWKQVTFFLAPSKKCSLSLVTLSSLDFGYRPLNDYSESCNFLEASATNIIIPIHVFYFEFRWRKAASFVMLVLQQRLLPVGLRNPISARNFC